MSTSAANHADAIGNEKERDAVEKPSRMAPPRCPKIAERAIKVRASDENSCRQPGIAPAGERATKQGESAHEPIERAEMQEARHEDTERTGHPRRGEITERFDHAPLHQDSMDNGDAAANHSRQHQGTIVLIHNHTPLY